jgi:hypothetical protein
MGILRAVRKWAPAHVHYLGSWTHALIAFASLGAPLAWGSGASVFAGIAVYGLCLILLPDLPVFRRAMQAALEEKEQQALSRQRSVVAQARQHFEARLPAAESARWKRFQAAHEDLMQDFNRRGLAEEGRLLQRVSHNYLLLLSAKIDIEQFNLSRPGAADLDSRRKKLKSDLEAFKPRSDNLSDSEQRLVHSWQEQLIALDRKEEQHRNIDVSYRLTLSELERLELELANFKASLIAQPSAQLASRIGETLQEVNASQRVIRDVGLSSSGQMEVLLAD